jgi:hypothetical protein
VSSVPRAALVGGILAVVLDLLVRIVLRNLHWIVLTVGMLYVLDRCSPDYPQVAASRAIRDSFEGSKVMLTGIVGVLEPDGYVGEIAMTVSNSERARVYDFRAICSYLVRAEPKRYWTSTDYYYGYVAPGETRVRLRLTTGIYLDRADLNSFQCKPPSFEVEKADLFRVRH